MEEYRVEDEEYNGAATTDLYSICISNHKKINNEYRTYICCLLPFSYKKLMHFLICISKDTIPIYLSKYFNKNNFKNKKYTVTSIIINFSLLTKYINLLIKPKFTQYLYTEYFKSNLQ